LSLIEDGRLDDPGPLSQRAGEGKGLDQLLIGEVGDILNEALDAVFGDAKSWKKVGASKSLLKSRRMTSSPVCGSSTLSSR
jgi:hypothetical protein